MTTFHKRESGAVLIVALVILAVTTLLGLAVMQGATMETKMVTSNQERQQAFNSAEAALKQAERYIDQVGFGNADLRSGCASATCFSTTCTNGFCFNGEFDATDAQADCSTFTGATPPTDGFWEDANIWATASRHVEVDLPGYPNGTVAGKYIIEFRCFTDQIDDGSGGAGTVATNTGDVVYRITARGTSQSGRIEAMVQGMYRANAP